MKIISLTLKNIEDVAAEAAFILSRGGIVIYPTDTIYGIGVDALDNEAVAKLYALKGRREEKPIHAMISSIRDMEKYGSVSSKTLTLAKHFLPGPLTLVIPKHPHLTTGITADRETIGLRIPDHMLCTALSAQFQNPITSTSANVSGMQTESSVEGILAQFGEKAHDIDLVINAGPLLPSPPSTVVDMTTTSPVILRKGIIPETAIMKAFK